MPAILLKKETPAQVLSFEFSKSKLCFKRHFFKQHQVEIG